MRLRETTRYICSKVQVLAALSVLALLLPCWVQAQTTISITFKDKALFCQQNTKGKIHSGRMNKKGKFKSDQKKFKNYKRKRKIAKRSSNKKLAKRYGKKIKKLKAKRLACQDAFNGSGGGGNEDGGSSDGSNDPPNPDAPSDFASAKAVIDSFCTSCHLNQHASWADLTTEDAWLAAIALNGTSLINPADAANSLLLQRISFYGGTLSNMPLSNNNNPAAFTQLDYDTVRNWILTLADGDGLTPPDPPDELSGNDLTTAQLFQCSGTPVASRPRIRRIDHHEWATVIGQMDPFYQKYSRSSSDVNPLTPDPAHQYRTFSVNETLNHVVLDRYMDFLYHAANGWLDGSTTSSAARPPEHDCMMDTGATPNSSCIENFVNVYLSEYVFFRTAKPDEIARLSAFATNAIASGETGGQSRSDIMRRITSAAWLMTGALFRAETGQGAQLPDGNFRLSDEELGLSLAYALTDSAPGAPSETWTARIYPAESNIQMIEDHVDDGTIGTATGITDIVNTNFSGVDTSRPSEFSEYWVGEKVRMFFREWLGTNAFKTTFHDDAQSTSGHDDPELYANASYNNQKGWNNYGSEITLDSQLDEMIARIVQNDSEVLRNLLTSRDFYVPSNLQTSFKFTRTLQYVYNITGDVQATRSDRWRTLPSTERAGILTHPAWLASHADNFENGPNAVHRGKWIRENLLCGTVPDIPITVEASFPPSTAHLSGRDRLNMATGSDYCQSCHSLMNPLGLPFEIYNHAGFLRESDHGSAPNGTSVLTNTGDPSLDVAVNDAIEMVELLAESEHVERCFIRQVFRYFMGRKEIIEDACTLTLMEEVYENSGGSMRAMLIALFQSPTFMHRQAPDLEE